MKPAILLIGASIILSGCVSGSNFAGFRFPPVASKRCDVTGLNKKSDPKLVKGLCAMSRDLGPVQVTSTCRTRKSNRGVKNSYHLYSRGCKAADIKIKGVKPATMLKWWGKNVGGGLGRYQCRNFVHVDTGRPRSWTWNFCKRKSV